MPSRERYDLSFSIVLGMGDHTITKDLVEEILADALNGLIMEHVIEEWQVSADSHELPEVDRDLSPAEAQAVVNGGRHPDEPVVPDLRASQAPSAAERVDSVVVEHYQEEAADASTVDPRTQKDEPGQ